MLYPYLKENVVGGGVEVGALIAFSLFLLVVGFEAYLLLKPICGFVGLCQSFRPAAQVTLNAPVENNRVQLLVTTEPTEPGIVLLVTPTPQPTMPVTPSPVEEIVNQPDNGLEGYIKQTIVGRFSNYWPPYGGTNCFTDCESFADGTKFDTAFSEGWKVLACPREWLLGTRFEYPPDSGLIWTCRDYGDDIYAYQAENGLMIYWFDFLSPTAFVDFGSYIQVQVYIPQQ